jgi:hypothetical protein
MKNKKKFEWAIIKREKRTGKIIKTISLDADSEIPEGVSNFSEYIRDLMKRDEEARAKAKAEREQQSVKPEVEESLTEMEESLYDWMDNWNNTYGFHKFGMQKYGHPYTYLKLEPNADEMFSLLGAVEDYVSNLKTINPQHIEYYNETVAYIQTLRKNRQLWDKVYDKFCKHWREEHPQPEIYSKEALWFDGKSWTGAEVLEKVLPHVDMIKTQRLTIKKVAEVFHVSYQIAYNKIVPFISPIFNAASVEIASTE